MSVFAQLTAAAMSRAERSSPTIALPNLFITYRKRGNGELNLLGCPPHQIAAKGPLTITLDRVGDRVKGPEAAVQQHVT